MAALTDEQIDFIFRDIQNRGVEMASLQHDLLDHVCCLLEEKLTPTTDFETLYYATIQTFYQKELKEIEEETLFLLTHKNYYAMKKIMLVTGAASALVLSTGILFKFMHWPGAGMLVVLGIVFFSLLFLPLLFTLKVKERKEAPGKLILTAGALSGILFCLATLFKLMHWPMANVLGISAIGIMLLVFLPVYFFTGIRQAETKMNAVITAILVVAGAGLFMSLVRSPGNSTQINKLNTSYFLRNEQILQNEQKLVTQSWKNAAVNPQAKTQSQQIMQLCNELKSYILEQDNGRKITASELEKADVLLTDGWVRDHFKEGSIGAAKLQTLKQAVETYNQLNQKTQAGLQVIPVANSVLDKSEERTLAALNGLTQIQLLVLQNERNLLAVK